MRQKFYSIQWLPLLPPPSPHPLPPNPEKKKEKERKETRNFTFFLIVKLSVNYAKFSTMSSSCASSTCPNFLKSSRKHTFIILIPFYVVKLGFTGVYIIFLISAVLSRNVKISEFLSENFQFLVGKF